MMNSEFKAVQKRVDPCALQSAEDDSYRIKLLKCVRKFPEYFIKLPVNTTFRMFFEGVNQRFTRIIESDCKEIFKLLDPQGKGVIDGAIVIPWAETGKLVQRPVQKERARDPLLGVREAALNICGRNVHVLENCFNSREKESDTSMTYDTFYRLLREGGLGKDPRKVRDLYLAVAGDVSVLYKALPGIHEEIDMAAAAAFANKTFHQAQAEPTASPSAKAVVTEGTYAS